MLFRSLTVSGYWDEADVPVGVPSRASMPAYSASAPTMPPEETPSGTSASSQYPLTVRSLLPHMLCSAHNSVRVSCIVLLACETVETVIHTEKIRPIVVQYCGQNLSSRSKQVLSLLHLPLFLLPSVSFSLLSLPLPYTSLRSLPSPPSFSSSASGLKMIVQLQTSSENGGSARYTCPPLAASLPFLS